MNLPIPDDDEVAKDEFVVTVRLRVSDEAALMAAAYAKIQVMSDSGLLPCSSEFKIEEHILKRRTEIYSALAGIFLSHFNDPKSGIEMIAAEISGRRPGAEPIRGGLSGQSK
jgi:hypothetical protein